MQKIDVNIKVEIEPAEQYEVRVLRNDEIVKTFITESLDVPVQVIAAGIYVCEITPNGRSITIKTKPIFIVPSINF